MDMEVWQVRPDARTWSIMEASFDKATFFAAQMASPYLIRGAADDVFAFVKLDDEVQWSINGQSIARNHLIVFAPGAEWAGRSSYACQWGAIRISLAQLRRFAEGAGAPNFSLEPGETRIVPANVEVVSQLRDAFRLEFANALTPGTVVGEGPYLSSIAHHALSTLVLNLQDDLPPPPSSRESVVRRALAYLREHQDDVVHISDLCLAIGVSDRWLRESFQNVYQASPGQLLRLRRLHQARRQLTSAPKVDSVSAVATDYGFFDLGRFSMSYRKLFGELPSATLQRRA
jgi:AraC family ethanolamine operon transcriptional activator